MTKIKKTILLINLGTPESDHPKAIRSYLKAFLNDPRVIDLPFFIRWPLVNLVIIPFRYQKTAHAYQQIWTAEGSPLFAITKSQRDLLADYLGEDYHVAFAMRYGQSSIPAVLAEMGDVADLTILPLFPQYSSAATGSALQEVLNYYAGQQYIPKLSIINEFYQHPAFIHAYAQILREQLANKPIDKIIFSYHGLPERHVDKIKCQAACDRIKNCPAITNINAACYRAQCMLTSQLLAAALPLTPDQYITSFQSRLGKTPWIKPYTDLLLPDLIQQGVKNIAVVSPSFVADCLETLEEINIRLREQWASLGGGHFIFIPSLNTHPFWIEAMAKMCTKPRFVIPARF